MKRSFAAEAVRLFLRQLIYHFMCCMMTLGVLAFLSDKTGILITQVCCLAFSVFLPYLYLFKIGFDLRNIADAEKIEMNIWRGFGLGFCACGIYIAAGLLLIAAKAGLVGEAFLPIYRLINSPFMPLNQVLLPSVLTLSEQSWAAVIFSAATTLAEPISYGLGYLFGFKRISFSETVLRRS